MTPAQQAAANDASFIEFLELAAELLPSGSRQRFGSIPAVVTGVPAPFFNGAWVIEPASDADLAAAIDHLRGSGLPFIVHVRSDLDEAERMLPPVNLAAEGRLPCFALTPRPIPPGPEELIFQRVDRADWDDFAAATADGFGMPREMVDALYVPAMLDQPSVRAYLGYVYARPVATAVAVRSGSTLGIYSIATVPDARGRGYGTAATWELMRDAEPGWEVAVLQASDMGRPVYERMGFRLVREFVEYVDRTSA